MPQYRPLYLLFFFLRFFYTHSFIPFSIIYWLPGKWVEYVEPVICVWKLHKIQCHRLCSRHQRNFIIEREAQNEDQVIPLLRHGAGKGWPTIFCVSVCAHNIAPSLYRTARLKKRWRSLMKPIRLECAMSRTPSVLRPPLLLLLSCVSVVLLLHTFITCVYHNLHAHYSYQYGWLDGLLVGLICWIAESVW